MENQNLPAHSGDGAPATAQTVHDVVRANLQKQPAQPAQAMPAKIYGPSGQIVTVLDGITPEPAKVIETKLKDARDFERSQDESSKNKVLNWIKYALIGLAMAINGAWVRDWVSRQEGGSLGALDWLSPEVLNMVGLAGLVFIGPIMALYLFDHIVKGFYIGWEKLIAWGLIAWVGFEEFATMKATRDLEWEVRLMNEIAPIGYVLTIFGIFGIIYFDYKKKDARDMKTAKRKTENAIWKNAYGAQMESINREAITRRLRGLANIIGNSVAIAFTVTFSILQSPFVKWLPAWRAAKANLTAGNSLMTGQGMLEELQPTNAPVNPRQVQGSRKKGWLRSRWDRFRGKQAIKKSQAKQGRGNTGKK